MYAIDKDVKVHEGQSSPFGTQLALFPRTCYGLIWRGQRTKNTPRCHLPRSAKPFRSRNVENRVSTFITFMFIRHRSNRRFPSMGGFFRGACFDLLMMGSFPSSIMMPLCLRSCPSVLFYPRRSNTGIQASSIQPEMRNALKPNFNNFF